MKRFVQAIPPTLYVSIADSASIRQASGSKALTESRKKWFINLSWENHISYQEILHPLQQVSNFLISTMIIRRVGVDALTEKHVG